MILVACQALFIRKDDPYALVARARTYARMGIVKESLDDVNAVLKDDPDNHQVGTASDLSIFSDDVEEILGLAMLCVHHVMCVPLLCSYK